jgi:hypothetical protein
MDVELFVPVSAQFEAEFRALKAGELSVRNVT